MLCNIYIKESTQELRNIGIRSSSPIFFVDVSQQTIMKIKTLQVKNALEIYLVQDDPYLKDLSNKWMNGGVQLPEVRIVEKQIQLPPKIIERIVEVPVEVIKEVEVVKEVIKEVIREVYIESKRSDAKEPEEGYLIDTKIAFNDFVSKSKNSKSQKNQQENKNNDILPLPDVVTDPLLDQDDTMPILLEVDNIIEERPEESTAPSEKENTDKSVKSQVKKTRKKKEQTKEPLTEFTVSLTEEELQKYKDEIKE
jgi:hypothetical protein